MMTGRKEIIKAVYNAWHADRVSERAAALAFYSLISLVPLAVLGTALISFIAGPGVIETHVLSFGSSVFGTEATPFFGRIFEGVEALTSNIFYSVVGVLVLLYGASRLFVHLRRAFNDIFVIEVNEERGVVQQAVQERGISLLYLILAFVLAIVFIAANVAVATSLTEIREMVGITLPTTFFHALNTLVSLVIVGGLYALLYRIGSQFNLSWSNAFSGGVVAALFFLILNGVFAYYLQSSLFLSVFGPSIFVIALLLWIYYGLQILFIGAEVADVFQRDNIST